MNAPKTAGGGRRVAGLSIVVDDDEDNTYAVGETPGGTTSTPATLTSIPGSRTSKKWSGDEDEKLKAAVDGNGGKNWKKIAEMLPGRSDVQCLHRWQKVLRPGLIKGSWTKEVR